MAESQSDLVGKEFIFEYGVDRILPPSDKTGGVFAIEQRACRRERITRCRDCAHYFEGDCLLLHVAMPDMDGGFCAWGERGDR